MRRTVRRASRVRGRIGRIVRRVEHRPDAAARRWQRRQRGRGWQPEPSREHAARHRNDDRPGYPPASARELRGPGRIDPRVGEGARRRDAHRATGVCMDGRTSALPARASLAGPATAPEAVRGSRLRPCRSADDHEKFGHPAVAVVRAERVAHGPRRAARLGQGSGRHVRQVCSTSRYYTRSKPRHGNFGYRRSARSR